MKNNGGKGLYEVGEQSKLPCGCEVVAEVVGYTQYVHPDCKYDNGYHPSLPRYQFKGGKER